MKRGLGLGLVATCNKTFNDLKSTGNRLLMVIFLMMMSGAVFGQTTYSTPGTYTWTCPPNVTSIQIEAWGGGGAGGGVGTAALFRVAGGGGGGAYAKSTSVTVVPGNTYTITVGAGGTGVSAATGNTGGSSSFGSTIIAVGGAGGLGNNTASSVAGGAGGTGSTGSVTWNGGTGGTSNGTGSTAAASGGGGGGAGNTANGGNANISTAGTGGTTGGGTGATGINTNTSTAGNTGNAPGGGGGGARGGSGNTTARLGGAGGAGRVVLTYTGYCSPVSTSTYHITSVSTNSATTNFTSTSGNGNGYSNFYDTKQVIATQGTNFTVSFAGVTPTSNTFGWAIWIDWDKNNTFDTSERVYVTSSFINSGTSSNIAVPALQAAGDYVMRILADYNLSNPSNSCSFSSTTNGGEAEDYKLTVVATSSNPILGITGTTAHGSSCPTVAATSQTYTITNSGGSTASGITVVSSDPQFVVSALSSTSIAAGASATYVVTFTPSSAGAKTATITVASTTSGSNSPTSNLTGTGTTAANGTVTTSAIGTITAKSGVLNGTADTVGSCPVISQRGFVYSVTATNATPTNGGTGVTTVPVTGTGTGAFTNTPNTLLSSTQYSYRAYVLNGSTYTYGSVVNFTTLHALAITGTLNNGSTCPTVAATPQTYTITNNSTATVTGITVGSSNTEFAVSGLSSTSIAANGTATYVVTFTPATAGAKTATITIASSQPNTTSSLTGTGTTAVTPAVTSSAATLVAITTASLNASASTFGVCPSTTVKGFVISQTSVNNNPIIGGTGVTNEAVATLGTQGAFTKAITGLLSGTGYSYKAYLYDGTTYTYGAVITFTTVTPPANDLCADATSLVINAAAVSGTMVGASASSSPFDTYKDVWYKFTPLCTVLHTIEVTGYSGDIDLYIYNQSSACPTTATNIGYSGNSDPTEFITNTFTAGVVYYIRLRAYNPAAEGSTFTISARGVTPAQPASITAGTTVCLGSTVTFTAPTNVNASSWTWTLPAGWSGTSTTNTINAVVGASGSISVTADNCYGSSTARTVAFTSIPTPTAPLAITGNNSICINSVNTYSIAAVSGATSYNWTLPSGWTGTSTSTSISATAGTTGGNISVTASNACGSSSAQTLAITVNAATNPSGTISVASSTCGTTTLAYSVPSASIYWQTTATGTSTTLPTTANYVATTSQTYYARAFDGTCWSIASASLPVTVNIAPAITDQPDSQSISTGNPVTFSVVTTGTVLSYQWEVNSGSGWGSVTTGTGGNTADYTIDATTLAMNGNQYRCVVTAQSPCSSVTSSIATLSVANGPCYETTFASTLPVGWEESNTNMQNSSGDYSLQFNAVNDFAILPYDAELIDHIEFDLRNTISNDNTWTLLLQGSNDKTTWTTINTYTGGATSNTFTPAISSLIDKKYVRFFMSARTNRAAQIDNLKVFCSDKTIVRFASATYTDDEDTGTVQLCLNIFNPSATVNTTANVVMTTTGTHISTTTYPVTFLAGSDAQQCVTLNITDNATCSDTTNYTFEIQSLAGDPGALLGSINTTVLTITDDDSTPQLINESFTTGLGNFKQVSETGANTIWSNSADDGYVTIINGFGSGSNERDLLIYRTPIDFDNATAESLVVDYNTRYSGAQMKVFYSTNFNGVFTSANTVAATWTEITTLSGSATGSTSTNYVNTIPLTSLTGTGYIAFIYTSTTTSAKEYIMNDVKLNANYCGVPPVVVCIPSNTINNTVYLDNVSFVGTQNDINNPSTFSTSPTGYQDFTGLAENPSQIQGEGINIKIDTNGPNSMVKSWIDINQDGDFGDDGELIFDSQGISVNSTTFGYQLPLSLDAGDYRIRIRVEDGDSENYGFDYCDDLTSAGETEDYLLTVTERCGADIETVTKGERCGTGSVTLNASTISSGVTEFRWYTAATGGTYTTSTNVGNATTFNTPSITATTTYYVTAYNGSCETGIRRAVKATVKEVPEITFTPIAPIACGDNTAIELTADEGIQVVYLVDENFDVGNLGASAFENRNIVNNGNTINPISRWQKQTSTFTPSEGEDSWMPAISSGYGTNKFVFSNSDVDTYEIDHGLELRNSINTTDFQNLSMSYRIYFSRYLDDNDTPADEFVSVEVSVNGGTTYTPLSTPVLYATDEGTPGEFAQKTIDISDYIDETNLKFRIRYYADIWGEGVAVDDIQIYGSKTLTASYSWSGSDITVYTDEDLQIPYVEGTEEDTVYIVPALSLLESASFNIAITTTLTNSCPLIQSIPVTNNSKIWAGTTTDWNTAANWKPSGVPTSTNCIIIPNIAIQPNIPVATNVVSKTLEVKDDATLVIPTGSTITVTDEITIEPDGVFEILDGGSLVQVTDVLNATANNNSGKINMERITKPVYRYDFTYWSSPVFADNDSSNDSISVANETEFNLKKLSPMTLFDKYYKWAHAAVTPGWVTIPVGVESMVPGRGYIVRAPQTYGATAVPASYQPYTANFIGVPNNGIVHHDVSGPDTWNLLGNPYPSAISADAFFDANVGSGLGSTNTLEGTLYLWTHNTKITETGIPHIYSYSAGDYASYNGTGSTDTKESENDPTPDDEEDNKPTGYIAAGQSFFIKGTASGEALFNNGMRVAGENNQFFRPAPTEPLNNWETSGKHRVWLNMKGQTKGFNQLLVGYIENATNEWDIRFDGESFGGNQVTFYSLLENKKLTIQGRALPFNNQDEVPLGYKSTLNGTLTISIDEYDGLFEGQDIYLEDKLLNIVHNLKASAYSFTTTTGTFNQRFVLRYLPSEELSNPDHENIANGLIVYQEDNKITIKSQLEALEKVTIYDLLGRTIFDKAAIDQNEFSVENVVMNEQPLIIKVKLANGQIVNKKIVY